MRCADTVFSLHCTARPTCCYRAQSSASPRVIRTGLPSCGHGQEEGPTSCVGVEVDVYVQVHAHVQTWFSFDSFSLLYYWTCNSKNLPFLRVLAATVLEKVLDSFAHTRARATYELRTSELLLVLATRSFSDSFLLPLFNHSARLLTTTSPSLNIRLRPQRS